jgi:hypothetical protein
VCACCRLLVCVAALLNLGDDAVKFLRQVDESLEHRGQARKAPTTRLMPAQILGLKSYVVAPM